MPLMPSDDDSLAPQPTTPEDRREDGPETEGPESGPQLDLERIPIDGFVIGLFVLALLIVLRLTRDLVLPIVVAMILALLLEPFVRWLQKLRLPRAWASGLLLLALLGTFVGGLQLTVEPAREWLADAPRSLRSIERKVSRFMQPVEEVTEAARQVEDLTKIDRKSQQVEVKSEPSFGQSLFAGTQTLIASTLVTFFLTFFFLASGSELFTRWAALFGPRRRMLRIVRQIQRDVSGHLWTISVINAGLGAAVGLACYLAGLPNPVLWGALAAALNFVPYLGAVLGVLIVGAAALLTLDDPLQALVAPGAYMVLTGVEGSLLTPMVLGRRFSLHPAIVFVALLFWTYLWGIPGALLAVPLLLIFKIICDNVPKLAKLGVAMSR